MNHIKILVGDVRDRLRELPDKSIHCCITSPPYYGLRDYGTGSWDGGDPGCDHKKQAKAGSFKCACGAVRTDQQIGLEGSPAGYVNSLVEVFSEVHRVLRDDGTLWLNIGDSHAGVYAARKKEITSVHEVSKLKPADLIGIPWSTAFALRDFGWELRSSIVWVKPVVIPSSVRNRPSSAYEFIFMLSKGKGYFFDWWASREKAVASSSKQVFHAAYRIADQGSKKLWTSAGDGYRNMRDTWIINPAPVTGHHATFPQEIPRRVILAATSAKGVCCKCGAPYTRQFEEGPIDTRKTLLDSNSGRDTWSWVPGCNHDDGIESAIVLDPFFGSGTTGLVAGILHRDCIGIELSEDYAKLAMNRINKTGGFFYKADIELGELCK